jgi:hypothetical protein
MIKIKNKQISKRRKNNRRKKIKNGLSFDILIFHNIHIIYIIY